jgi:hypothetical protein
MPNESLLTHLKVPPPLPPPPFTILFSCFACLVYSCAGVHMYCCMASCIPTWAAVSYLTSFYFRWADILLHGQRTVTWALNQGP